ncbi:MAG: hypothetical protein K9G11_01495 [Rickettsiaceae bacterium]|nr:hypothetical protein [Rickettsiaceae bacterium]
MFDACSINFIHAKLPLNSKIGRDGCLLNKPEPSGLGYYKYCAQATPGTTYANPTINVKLQVCSAFWCVARSKDLSWNGECTIFPGPFVWLPLSRFCARIAVPEDTENSYSADPGYSYGTHLDSSGNSIEDDVIYDNNGDKVDFQVPKLCAYLDPGLATLWPDFFDVRPHKQPFHYGSDRINVLVRILIFVISMSDSIVALVPELLNDIIPSSKGTDWLKDVLKWISFLIKFIGQDIFIPALKAIGHPNNIVLDNLGCVTLPIGYLPPPYPAKLTPPLFTLKAKQICPTFPDGKLLDYQPVTSSDLTLYGSDIVTDSGCDMSPTENNAIQNTVRIGYDKIVPICNVLVNQNSSVSSTISSSISDQCVDIYHFTSMSDIHTKYNDILPVCSYQNANDSTPCVNVNSESFICNDNDNCKNGVRIKYATLLSNGTITTSNYYDNTGTYEPCDSSMTTNDHCQLIYGANFGNYKDLSVTFPQYVSDNDNSDLYTNSTINMGTSKDVPLEARVTRIYDETSSTPQAIDQICAYDLSNDSRNNLGCFKRPPSSKPIVVDCSTTIANSKCSSSYFDPKMFTYVQVGEFTTGGPLSLSIYDPNNPLTSDQYTEKLPTLNLGGIIYSAFATDNITSPEQPFFGHKATNYDTIIGNYENNIIPPASNAVYINGIEYTDGAYYRGANLICLESHSYATCPHDPKQCVLTLYTNATDIPCAKFHKLADSTYPGLYFCTSSDTNCSQVNSITYGSTTVLINKCESNYCYTHNLNGGIDPLCIPSTNKSDRILPAVSTLALEDTDYFDPSISNNIPSECDNTNMLNTEINNLSSTYPGITTCTSVQTSSCTFSSSHTADDNSQLVLSIYTCTNTDGSTSYCAVGNLEYDNNVCSLRNKTALEENWCVDVPQLTCAAITTADSSTGGATWPETNAGELATGTCAEGTGASSITRYCLTNYANKTASFENNDQKCYVSCPAVTEGNASWSESYATGDSTSNKSYGTCLPGYVLSEETDQVLERTCNSDGTLSALPTVPQCISEDLE